MSNRTRTSNLACEFLTLDHHIKSQGICISGLPAHDLGTCWCHLVEGLDQKIWVDRHSLVSYLVSKSRRSGYPFQRRFWKYHSYRSSMIHFTGFVSCVGVGPKFNMGDETLCCRMGTKFSHWYRVQRRSGLRSHEFRQDFLRHRGPTTFYGGQQISKQVCRGNSAFVVHPITLLIVSKSYQNITSLQI